MKTLILTLFFIVNLSAQSSDLLLLLDDGINPLTYDSGNLLALYNGDIGLSTTAWEDQSANGYDLTLFNTPTVVSNAINGHQAVRFDGVNQSATVGTPAINQPFTIYIVFKTLVASGGHILNDGMVGNAKLIGEGAPDYIYAGAGLASNPDPVVNVWNMLTGVFNGANSEVRTNNNAAIIGNAGLQNGAGLWLASYWGGAVNVWNGEIAYLIIRSTADNTATQNLFINYLKNRFGL